MGPSSQGETFFSQNIGGPSGGSLLSGGGIIIFRVTRRHFLAAAVDPAVSLSTHSILPMVLFVDHVDHAAPSASKVVDDGEAPDSNEPGNTRQLFPTRRGVQLYEVLLFHLRCEVAVATK